MAQRLAMEHEHVVDVAVFFAFRVRALDGGSGGKAGDSDAYALPVAGVRGHDLRAVLRGDGVAVSQ